MDCSLGANKHCDCSLLFTASGSPGPRFRGFWTLGWHRLHLLTVIPGRGTWNRYGVIYRVLNERRKYSIVPLAHNIFIYSAVHFTFPIPIVTLFLLYIIRISLKLISFWGGVSFTIPRCIIRKMYVHCINQ